jgi:hypothetical protein
VDHESAHWRRSDQGHDWICNGDSRMVRWSLCFVFANSAEIDSTCSMGRARRWRHQSSHALAAESISSRHHDASRRFWPYVSCFQSFQSGPVNRTPAFLVVTAVPTAEELRYRFCGGQDIRCDWPEKRQSFFKDFLLAGDACTLWYDLNRRARPVSDKFSRVPRCSPASCIPEQPAVPCGSALSDRFRTLAPFICENPINRMAGGPLGCVVVTDKKWVD